MSHFILDNCIYFNNTQFFFHYCTTRCTVRGGVIDLSCFQNRITFIIYNDTTFMWCVVHVLFDTNFFYRSRLKQPLKHWSAHQKKFHKTQPSVHPTSRYYIRTMDSKIS